MAQFTFGLTPLLQIESSDNFVNLHQWHEDLQRN
jgi:hypothetical protein